MSGLFGWLIEQIAKLFKWVIEKVWNIALNTLTTLVGTLLDSFSVPNTDQSWRDYLKNYAEYGNTWLPLDLALTLATSWIAARGTLWLWRLTIGRLFNR